MFTGIILAIGKIAAIERKSGDCRLTVDTGTLDLKDTALGDSIAVNGVCLTAVELGPHYFCADVSNETLSRTVLVTATIGSPVNLELALTPSTRMGGHMHMHMSDDHAMDPNSPRFANAKKLADKACADCHGKAGISKTDDNPNLAGQDALYFCKTMYDYRSRARNLPPIKTNDGLYVPNMNEVTDKLSDQDIVDLSEYYAHLRAQ